MSWFILMISSPYETFLNMQAAQRVLGSKLQEVMKNFIIRMKDQTLLCKCACLHLADHWVFIILGAILVCYMTHDVVILVV